MGPDLVSMTGVLDCFEKSFVPGIPGLRTAEADAPDLLGRMKGAVLRALQRVDELPRDHPVWRYMAVQTVNEYRLFEHCARLLRETPLDKDSLWARIAGGLANGSSDFPHHEWQQLLVAEERFDTAWPIFASLQWSLAVGDDDSVAELSSFLTLNGQWESALPILKDLEAGEHGYARVVLEEAYDRDHVIGWTKSVVVNCRGLSMPKIRINPPGLFPSERYGFSQIVVAQGERTVYLSGQVGCDEQLRMADLQDLGAQTRRALENIETAMQAAGGTRDDVVSLRIYIVGENIKETAAVTEALTGFFHPERFPAATWIGVSALARPEFLVEIEAIGVLG